MMDKSLFNVCPDSEFFGRLKDIDYICRRAREYKTYPSIFLAGRRWAGKTEILRRVHGSLFFEQSNVIPVYYRFKGYGSTVNFAEDFLKEIIKQYTAFRNREPQIMKAEISLDKLERRLIDDDAYDLADFIDRHREAKKGGDYTAALRNALYAPHLITHRSGTPVYLILDDLDQISGITLYSEGPSIMKEVLDALNSGSFSFLASSSTRNVLEGGALNGSIEVITLSGLDEEGALSMMSELCRLYNVDFDSEILTVAAGKLEKIPMYIKNIIWAAHRSGISLMTLKDFADLYANEIAEGNTGAVLRSSLRLGGLKDFRVLNECVRAGLPTSEEELSERLGYTSDELRKTIADLSSAGLIDANLGIIKWSGDSVLRDFISYTYETRVKGRSLEEVKTSIIRGLLKEGYALKGSKIQGKLKEEAASLLKSFNGQKILKALLKNQIFSERFKNGVYTSEGRGEDEVILPQIFGCFDTSRWEKSETGPRIVAAHGFQNSRYGDNDEVAWVVFIKEAPTQINLGDVDNFIRRSSLLRENFRTTKVVRWMIGKEGFTAEAQKKAESDGIYTSDIVQLRLLRDTIKEKGPAVSKDRVNIVPNKEYEVVLPSAVKAELVAVKAVEEIGAGMGFDENSIGQIKAALVEACINAFEHSRVRDSKVFLRFIAGGDRLTIHIENPGVDFDVSKEAVSGDGSTLPRKRGWGIDLMKGLMDEVRFEKIMGGSKIVMIKHLIKKEKNKDDKEA